MAHVRTSIGPEDLCVYWSCTDLRAFSALSVRPRPLHFREPDAPFPNRLPDFQDLPLCVQTISPIFEEALLYLGTYIWYGRRAWRRSQLTAICGIRHWRNDERMKGFMKLIDRSPLFQVHKRSTGVFMLGYYSMSDLSVYQKSRVSWTAQWSHSEKLSVRNEWIVASQRFNVIVSPRSC